jgi:hypothetical protein
MGGSKGGGGPQALYKPQNTGRLEDQLYKTAQGATPNYGMMQDYSNMQKHVTAGKLLSGQNIPQYNAGSNFKFNTPNLSYAPKSAYGNALNSTLDGMKQDMSQGMSQLNKSFASRGFGKSGLNYGAQTTAARNAAQNMAGVRSQYGLQQAKDQLDVDKMQGQMDLQRQGMQAGENMGRTQQSLAANQAFNQIQQNQIGTMGTLHSQIDQAGMRPYQMIDNLYKTNLGAPMMSSGQSGKGDPFSSLFGMGASIASAACLPRGTEIELEDGGSKPVETIIVGDIVRGGRVIATHSRRRAPGHKFYKHVFENGKQVIMSFGHPFFEKLETATAVEHDSPNTYDILTDKGYYYVNGSRLGSTIERDFYA